MNAQTSQILNIGQILKNIFQTLKHQQQQQQKFKQNTNGYELKHLKEH